MPFDVAPAFLVAIERELGCALPSTYRAAMARSNGGEVVALGDAWFLHPILDSSTRERLRRTTNHVLRETKLMNEWPGFPAGALSIAENGAGDRLVFVRGGGGFRPEVFFWSHETRELELAAADFAQLASGRST